MSVDTCIDIIRHQNYGTGNRHLPQAAGPSTTPASISKTSAAVHNSSLPMTSLPIDSTATVPDNGGPKKIAAEASLFDKWSQPTKFRSWKISFKSGVSRSSKYPRAAVLWTCVDEDAKSIDDLITSASIPGRPILDFENLDFKIASGLRKILTRNFKK